MCVFCYWRDEQFYSFFLKSYFPTTILNYTQIHQKPRCLLCCVTNLCVTYSNEFRLCCMPKCHYKNSLLRWLIVRNLKSHNVPPLTDTVESTPGCFEAVGQAWSTTWRKSKPVRHSDLLSKQVKLTRLTKNPPDV